MITEITWLGGSNVEFGAYFLSAGILTFITGGVYTLLYVFWVLPRTRSKLK